MLATWYTQTDTPLNAPIKIAKSNTQLVNQEKQLIYFCLVFFVGRARKPTLYLPSSITIMCVYVYVCIWNTIHVANICSYLGLFLDCFRHSWKQFFVSHICMIFSSSEGKLMDSGTGSTMVSATHKFWINILSIDFICHITLIFLFPSTFIHGDKLFILFIAIR